MNRIISIAGLAALLLISLSACDSSGRSANPVTNPVVEEKAAALLDAIKAQDYERAINQYSDSFFSKQSKEGWMEKLKTLMAERGPMRSFELKRSQSDTRFSGKFYILEYMAVHEGNKRLNHIITFLLPVDGGGIRLVGHKMSPWEDEREDQGEIGKKIVTIPSS